MNMDDARKATRLADQLGSKIATASQEELEGVVLAYGKAREQQAATWIAAHQREANRWRVAAGYPATDEYRRWHAAAGTSADTGEEAKYKCMGLWAAEHDASAAWWQRFLDYLRGRHSCT